MPSPPEHDEVLATVDTFFAAFVSGPGVVDGAVQLRRVLDPDAVIVRAGGAGPTTYSVDTFVEPRVELLESGALADFREWVTSARVDLSGDIAQVWCTYAKEWVADGEPQQGRGTKSIQLVRTQDRWRITAVVWDDERPGLRVQDPGPSHPQGQPPGQ
jgi:hypothetical protein